MGDAVTNLLFWVFAFLSVTLAFGVVLSQHILRAAVSLAGVLAISAGFYLFLGMEFLAAVQIMVYVGGIVVLLVFAIMLTNMAGKKEVRSSTPRLLSAAAVAAGFYGLSVVVIGGIDDRILNPFFSAEMEAKGDIHPVVGAGAVGRLLLDMGPQGYVLPFEVISLLLLAAVIGGIVVARKDAHG